MKTRSVELMLGWFVCVLHASGIGFLAISHSGPSVEQSVVLGGEVSSHPRMKVCRL